jgi:hypothetical protein
LFDTTDWNHDLGAGSNQDGGVDDAIILFSIECPPLIWVE